HTPQCDLSHGRFLTAPYHRTSRFLLWRAILLCPLRRARALDDSAWMLATAVACGKCRWTSVFEMLGCTGGNGLANADRQGQCATGSANHWRPARPRGYQWAANACFSVGWPSRAWLKATHRSSSAPSVGQLQ